MRPTGTAMRPGNIALKGIVLVGGAPHVRMSELFNAVTGAVLARAGMHIQMRQPAVGAVMLAAEGAAEALGSFRYRKGDAALSFAIVPDPAAEIRRIPEETPHAPEALEVGPERASFLAAAATQFAPDLLLAVVRMMALSHPQSKWRAAELFLDRWPERGERVAVARVAAAGSRFFKFSLTLGDRPAGYLIIRRIEGAAEDRVGQGAA